MNQTPEKKKSKGFYSWVNGTAFGSFGWLVSPIIVIGLLIGTVVFGPIIFIVHILKGSNEDV